MSDPSLQTVRLARGAHASPAEGACVIELASMLAGERFSDRPRAVCPVIAGFLRLYNDRLPPADLQELYPLASHVVGSASTWRVRRRRARRLREWARTVDPAASVYLPTPFESRERIVLVAAHAAIAIDPKVRRSTVADLVDELVAMGPRTARASDRAAFGTDAWRRAAARAADPTQRYDSAIDS